VSASTDLAAQYFFRIGRSAMEYQLGRFELSLRLLQGVDPEVLAGFDDPRERLTHSYRSWLLSALDRVDEAMAVAEDGLASAQRDRQNWAVHVFETWKGRHLLHLGRLDEANAVLEGRFHLTDAHLIVGVLDAALVVALGRIKLHIGDERGANEVAEIAEIMLTTTVPVVRRHAAWYLAVHAMAAGDSDQAHRWPMVTAAARWTPSITCCGSSSTPEPYATPPGPGSGYANSGSAAGSSRWTVRNWDGSRSRTPSFRSRASPLRATPTAGSPTGCSFRPIP